MNCNIFKVIKKVWHHLSSLDTETEAAYDNYKSYDWELSIFWFAGMTANKKLQPVENRAYTLLAMLHGKQTSLGFVIFILLKNYFET